MSSNNQLSEEIVAVLRQALEALELHAKQYPHMQKGYTVDAIASLRQAIARAEHDPYDEVFIAYGLPKQDNTELDAICQDLQEKTYTQAMRIAELEAKLAEAAVAEQHKKQEPAPTIEDLEQEIYQNTRNFVSLDVMEWMLKRYYTHPYIGQPRSNHD